MVADVGENCMRIDMKRIFARLVVLFLCQMTGLAIAGERVGIVSMNFDLSAPGAGKAARLWIPYPVSDRDQLVSDIAVSGEYDQGGVYTDQLYGTPMLSIFWDKGAANRTVRFSFRVERQEVDLRNMPVGEVAWDPADYALFLAPTSLGPLDGVVRKTAESIVAGHTSVRAKARAVYDWVCEHMYRAPETRGCGPGDVCSLLEKPGGKCADIHSVFVALARAAGVPAREVFGLRLPKDKTQDITTWQHCWAEFYLPGFGWVPVDPGDVRKMMLKENLQWTDAATARYRDYYWGGLDSFRVKVGQGRDLLLNPPQQGGPVNYLMYPYAQVGAETLDWLSPETFAYTITFREVP